MEAGVGQFSIEYYRSILPDINLVPKISHRTDFVYTYDQPFRIACRVIRNGFAAEVSGWFRGQSIRSHLILTIL